MLLGSTLSIHKRWNYSQKFSCKFCYSFKRTYFVKHFKRLLLDKHKVTTENYYPLSEISVFWITDHGKYLVYEFDIRISGKIVWKLNDWKGERSETLLKTISYVEISLKLFAKQLCSERTSWVSPKQQLLIYWHKDNT